MIKKFLKFFRAEVKTAYTAGYFQEVSETQVKKVHQMISGLEDTNDEIKITIQDNEIKITIQDNEKIIEELKEQNKQLTSIYKRNEEFINKFTY